MSRQTIAGRVLGMPIGVVAFAAAAVFALAGNQSTPPRYVAGAGLEDIVKSAQTWGIPFISWFGRQAPDMTLEDVQGRRHTLSDYRGRDVLLVFWATWCPACNMEIPHLIELRKAFSEDELAILAITNETPERLKHFVQDEGINYDVASLGGVVLPAPFGEVASVPTMFFIDRRGIIKLATVGLVSQEESKAILLAGQ